MASTGQQNDKLAKDLQPHEFAKAKLVAFETKDRDARKPEEVFHLKGLFLDLIKYLTPNQLGDDDFVSDTIAQSIIEARKRKILGGAPYLLLDLQSTEGMQFINSETGEDIAKELASRKLDREIMMASPKFVVSARDCVGFRGVGPNKTMSVGQLLPLPRAFQALNLMLEADGQTGRVIPFGVSDEEHPTEIVGFYGLIVNREEHRMYLTVLQEAIKMDGPDIAFQKTAKLSYSIVEAKGLELDLESLRPMLVGIVPETTWNSMQGVLFRGVAPSMLTTELATKYHIYG